ncbi:MAG: spondin domain-containing protein [Phycisphaerales bacterium JB041]
MRRLQPTLALAAILGASGPALAGDSIATYRVDFDAAWSADNHPLDFPNNPHFSGLIGGTHHAGVHFWQEGALASPGIESMAETGSKSALTAEVNAAIGTGEAEYLLSGPGLGNSPGTVSMTFQVSASHPLASIVTMIAPSPDWFVGVDSQPLALAGVWQDQVVVSLAPYDSGTDSGTSYNSLNQDTQPPEPIYNLSDEYPFEGTPPLGTFTFTLLSVEGCLADFNTDSSVNTQDVLAFLNSWNADESAADINADQTVNTQDVLAFLNLWTAGCD